MVYHIQNAFNSISDMFDQAEEQDKAYEETAKAKAELKGLTSKQKAALKAAYNISV